MTTTVYSHGLCYLSACTNDTDDEATASVNLTNPTGLSHEWAIADEAFASGAANGFPCPDQEGFRHVHYIC